MHRLQYLLAIICLMMNKNIAEGFNEYGTNYFQDNAQEDFGQERSLNYLNVQLSNPQPERETVINQLNPIYLPYPVQEYYLKPTYYQTQNPLQYGYNIQKPTSFYSQNLYSNNFVDLPPNPIWLETPEKPSLGAEFTAPLVILRPSNNPTYNTKPKEQNLTDLLNNLQQQQKPKNEWLFYNAPFVHQELSENGRTKMDNVDQFKNNKENIDKSSFDALTISALLNKPSANIDSDKVLYIKPSSMPSSAPNPSFQSFLQQLTNRKLTQERLGAFYLRNSIFNKK